jgi:hypothetical protein
MLSRIAQSLGLVTILALVTTTPFAAGAAGSVVRKGSRLSLNFHDTALKGVLQQLQRDAQITVKVPPSLLDRTVTVKLRNMEIDPALETLFKSASLDNFAIVHEPGAHGRITVVLVEAGKGTVASPARVLPTEQNAGVSETPSPATEDSENAIKASRGVRWLPAKAASGAAEDDEAPAPIADSGGDFGTSGMQEMPVPASAVPPSMINLPPEPGPAVPGAPEGAPLTPQMRAAMGFPLSSKH